LGEGLEGAKSATPSRSAKVASKEQNKNGMQHKYGRLGEKDIIMTFIRFLVLLASI
jgi:hypothetical protein